MSNLAEVAEISTQIVEFQEFEKNLAEYRERYEGVVYDLTEVSQEKRARSDRLSIGKVISKLDAAHKAVKAPLKEKVDLLDGERKRIKDQLLGVQGGIKSQIDDHEAKIKAREDALLARVEAIKAFAVFDEPMTLELVSQRLESVKATVVDDTFENFEAEAGFSKLKALETLEPLLAGIQAQEAARIEAERKHAEDEAEARRVREETIAREATEKAEREAETRIEAEKEAKESAERQAKEAAERAATDAKEAAEKAEREQLSRRDASGTA